MIITIIIEWSGPRRGNWSKGNEEKAWVERDAINQQGTFHLSDIIQEQRRIFDSLVIVTTYKRKDIAAYLGHSALVVYPFKLWKNNWENINQAQGNNLRISGRNRLKKVSIDTLFVCWLWNMKWIIFTTLAVFSIIILLMNLGSWKSISG